MAIRPKICIFVDVTFLIIDRSPQRRQCIQPNVETKNMSASRATL